MSAGVSGVRVRVRPDAGLAVLGELAVESFTKRPYPRSNGTNTDRVSNCRSPPRG
jgi:hypothetical protein